MKKNKIKRKQYLFQSHGLIAPITIQADGTIWPAQEGEAVIGFAIDPARLDGLCCTVMTFGPPNEEQMKRWKLLALIMNNPFAIEIEERDPHLPSGKFDIELEGGTR